MMKNKMFLSAILLVILLESLGFINVQSAGTTICGQYVRKTFKAGFEFEYYLFITSDETLSISHEPSFQDGGYYRLYDAVITHEPVLFADGTKADGHISSWSNYEQITSLQDCAQEPPIQPPSQIGQLCGWVDFAPPGTGVLELLLTTEDGRIFSFLILEEPFFSQLMSLPPPAYFRINNPKFYNDDPSTGMVVSWTNIEKVETCAPELRVTNFALAETLTQDALAASHFTTQQLRRNILWVEVTNTGGAPFVAPSDGGQYILQVIVKQPGGKLEEQEFDSLTSLEPLGSLAPGESQILMAKDLFFWTTVENAELEIFLEPDSSLGLSNSILSTKTITIEPHPDSYLNCIATVSQAIFKVNAARTGKTVWSLAELGAAVVEKASKGNIRGALSEVWRWFLGQLLEYGLGDAGELFSAGLEAASEMGNQDIPCLKVSDFINAFLYQMLLNGYKSGGVITESPVYPLVVNTAGQRTGFLENGQIVQEIPNSQVSQIGERRAILFVGEDVSDIRVMGHSNGYMDLYVTLPQDGGGYGYTLSYENIQVTQGMRAVLATADREHMLVVDIDGDDQDDLRYPPSKLEQITKEGELLAIQVPTTTPISPPEAPTAVPSQPVQQPGICWGAIGLVVFPLLLFLWKQR